MSPASFAQSLQGSFHHRDCRAGTSRLSCQPRPDSSGLSALGDQADTAVLVARLALQGIAVIQQAPFGVLLKALPGLVGIDDAPQLVTLVYIFSRLAGRVGGLQRTTAFVVSLGTDLQEDTTGLRSSPFAAGAIGLPSSVP